MLAWVLDDSPGAYRLKEVAEPPLGADDVSVRPVTSALNHMDLWVTRGQPRPPLPHIPGCDVAGRVEAVGRGVRGVNVGDEVVVNPAIAPLAMVIAHGDDAVMHPGFEVIGERRWGGHAERVTVPARNVTARPPSRTWEECGAFPSATVTALRMLRRARLRAGECVLIVGIGGGVSMASMAIAQVMGAIVFVTSQHESKRSRAIDLGAKATFRSDGDWPTGVDVVVDSVGPATWDRSMHALGPGGRLVVCGGTSGTEVQIDARDLSLRQIEVIGSTMGGYGEFADVSRLVERGLPVAVDTVFDFAEYPAALERLESGRQMGKIVLRH